MNHQKRTKEEALKGLATVGIDENVDIAITLPLKDWFDVLFGLFRINQEGIYDKVDTQAREKCKTIAKTIMKAKLDKLKKEE